LEYRIIGAIVIVGEGVGNIPEINKQVVWNK